MIPNTKRLFWLIVFLSPGWWWVVTQPMAVFRQWQRFPSGMGHKLVSIYSPDNLKAVEDMRWMSGSRLFFNKGTVLVREGWDYLQYLAPRFYFLAGDGTNFSPSRVEPLPAVLFPFWILGIWQMVRERQWKGGLLLATFGLVGYLSGVKNMAILWPILLIYVYISTVGLQRYKRAIWLVVVYGLYISARGIWIR